MSGMSMGGSALSGALSALGYHYGTGAIIAIAAAYAVGALNPKSAAPSARADGSERDLSTAAPQQSKSRVEVRS